MSASGDRNKQVPELRSGGGSLATITAHVIHQASGAGASPREGRQLHAHRIEPRGLAGSVSVVALFNATRPAAVEVCRYPSTATRRRVEPVPAPGARVGRVLQHPPPTGERR